jgi:AmmeMemoRadiSam system protein A
MNVELTKEQQKALLNLARASIRRILEKNKEPEAAVTDPVLKEKRGAFVTLKVDGRLRGCIGYPLPSKPLYLTVSEMAVAAATQDHRFRSLQKEELPHTQIEISVLSLPQEIKDPDKIEVGRHGLVISKGASKGLLLPQVPGEYGWDRETFLRHGCLKAGLDEDEWKKDATIEVFTAQVFSEEE